MWKNKVTFFSITAKRNPGMTVNSKPVFPLTSWDAVALTCRYPSHTPTHNIFTDKFGDPFFLFLLAKTEFAVISVQSSNNKSNIL